MVTACSCTLTTTRRAARTVSRDGFGLPKVDSVFFTKPSVMSAMDMLERCRPAAPNFNTAEGSSLERQAGGHCRCCVYNVGSTCTSMRGTLRDNSISLKEEASDAEIGTHGARGLSCC